jgi:membrane-bound ClpP family serine protease
MNPFLVWAMICLSVAVLLFFSEMFIPSGGVIGFLAAASLVAGIVLLFKVDTTLGLVGALVSVMSVPFFVMMALRLWPSTPIARMMMLKSEPTTSLAEMGIAGADKAAESRKLVGATGVAITDLRPVGTCVINSQRTECLAESEMIRAGTKVVVTWAEGMTIKVKPTETVADFVKDEGAQKLPEQTA